MGRLLYSAIFKNSQKTSYCDRNGNWNSQWDIGYLHCPECDRKWNDDDTRGGLQHHDVFDGGGICVAGECAPASNFILAIFLMDQT